METQQIPDNGCLIDTPSILFVDYLESQFNYQKEKALKEIEKAGGQTAVNMALWLDSIDLKKDK